LTDWYAVAGIILGVAGIGATIFISFTVYKKQKKDGEKLQEVVDSINLLTQQKAIAEQKNKAYECRRILEHLYYLQNAEVNLKTFLTEYKDGDPTNETVKSFYGMSLDGIVRTGVYNMNDAIGQLQGRLNDNSLRKDFLDYLGAFNVLPERILKLNMPEAQYQCQGLIHFIDAQMKKIQEFTDRFRKEMEFN
jgi:hypothetical protein